MTRRPRPAREKTKHAIKNPSVDGFNIVKLGKKILLGGEECADVVLVDDLL